MSQWGSYLVNNLMDKSQLISSFVRPLIAKLVSQAIRQFQRLHVTLSGEDSGLKNTWDEICVQIQGEYSFHWDDYEDVVEEHLKAEVRKLNDYERFAIWLQSDQGMFFDESEDGSPEFTDDDLVDYLKGEIFQKAGNWSNERIRKYLG